MSGKKKWAAALAALALVLAAAFPGRAAVQEYRYQKSLALSFEAFTWNPEHVSVGLDAMCASIDEALTAEGPVQQREALLTVYSWAEDVQEAVQEMGAYCVLYENAYHDGGYVRAMDSKSQVTLGMVRLKTFLQPYVTGARDASEGAFREQLQAVETDLQWMQGVWGDAFADGENLSRRERVRTFAALFWDNAPAWGKFFDAVSQ